MTRKPVDRGPDLFAWADVQPAPAKPVTAPAPVKARKPKRQRPAVPVVEPVSSEPAPVVDFLAKRPTMARWILGGRRDLQAFDLWLARREGTMAPAPILPLARRARPPDTSPDSGAPERRTG